LRQEDGVVLRGMPIGKVRRLALGRDGVHVFAWLDQPIRPRVGYRMTVVTTTILGGRYLEVYAGPPDAEPLPEGTVFHGESSPNLMNEAAETMRVLKDALTGGGIISNLQVATAEIRIIAERANAGKGMLGRLLSEDETLYDNLSSSVQSLKNITERLDKGEGTLGRLLSKDDRVYEDLAATVTSLKGIAGRLERGEGTFGRLLSSDDRLYNDLSATMASLKSVTYRMEKGEGALGRLMADDELYVDVKKTVEELRAAIDDFRENTPVVTFSSLVFGAF
jgi:phospholipid/cholesterol/gamma-HCH transport system substrate-binding protein